MPCTNVTELIRATLDAEERLVSYRFIKRTCGSGIGGEDLLIGAFRDRPIADIINLDVESFRDSYPAGDELREFLLLKHFFALKGVLQVYAGDEAGGIGDFCTISNIGHENGEVIVDAEIAIDAVTEKIQACGHCGNCGDKHKIKTKRAGKPKRLSAPSIKDDPTPFSV